MPLRRFLAVSIYNPGAVAFDGSTYTTRGADLTGNANGRQWLVSFWCRRTGGNGNFQEVFQNQAGNCQVAWQTSNKIRFYCENGAGTNLTVDANTAITDTNWHHFAFSADTNFSAGNKLKWLYVDGVSDVGTVSDAGAAFTISFTDTDWVLGATAAHGSKLQANLADLYVNLAAYMDLSVASNLAKFYQNGRPVSLGGNGSAPTGSQPIWFMQAPASAWNTNRGSGGNFSTGAGSLTDVAGP